MFALRVTATRCSSRSPAGCPLVSLTSLRPSTSTKASVSLQPVLPGALDLAGHLGQPEPSRPRARQLVGGGELEDVARFRPRKTRLGALTRCLLPVGGRPRTVVGRLGPIGRRSRAVAFGTQENVVPTRVGFVLGVAQTSHAIAGLGAAITKLGRAITILRNQQPRRRRHVARVLTQPSDPDSTAPAPRSSADA